MKKFKLELIKPNLGFKIAHQNITFPSIRMFLDNKYRYEIDWFVYLPNYKCNLQRSFIWTKLQNQQFIYSILKEIYIPQIAAVVEGNIIEKKTIYKIIDGKQRLNAIISFCKNLFPIENNDDKFIFSELPANIQQKLLNFSFTGQIVYSYPDDKIDDTQLINWFTLINFAGTQQDEEHINFLNSKNIIRI